MRTWIKLIVMAFLITQTQVVFPQEYEMPGYINDISSCDMDGDGSNDIIISCPYTDSIVILFNDGTGNFSLIYYNRLCGSFIPCGLIDSDSLPDIITGTSEGISFIKNLGQGNLGDNLTIIETTGNWEVKVIKDINLDNLNDLVYTYTPGEYWGILKNFGNLNFTNEIIQSSSSTTDPEVGYITNDSLPEIVLSYSAYDRTSVNVNNGNLNFSEIVLEDNFNYETPVMNLDNQPTDDFAFVNYATNKVALYKYVENGQFELQSNFFATGTYGIATFLADDFNQDGFDDFIISRCNWYDCTDSIYVYYNDMNWSFYESSRFYIGNMGFFNLKSADLNGDSFPDLYMSGAGTNGNKTLKILWNDGTGSFSDENPVKIDEISPQPCDLDIFPNPFVYNLTIELGNNFPGEYSIFIRNIYGQLLKSFCLNSLESKNKNKLIWDGYDDNHNVCSSGIYLVTVKSNSYQISKKIIKY